MKYINMYLIIVFTFCSSSCFTLLYQTPKLMRENIVKRNEHITKVGIIENYTLSDDKYSALHIVFDDNRQLYLTLIDNYAYQIIGRRTNYRICRIGDYALGNYVHWLNSDGTREVNSFYRDPGVKAELLERKTGIKLRTVQDAINNYNALYDYILSLPYLDVNKNEHQEINKNNLDKYSRFSIIEDSKTTIYPFRIDWNDEYFESKWHISVNRRPNYYYRKKLF